ncbi:MAG: hypothetical protein KF726_01820 [Anaerolineae bacterium]|nr:hypothetical protein [Anaerolineae bacterium]
MSMRPLRWRSVLLILLFSAIALTSVTRQLAQAQEPATPTPLLTVEATITPTLGFRQQATATSTLQLTGAPFITYTASEMMFPALVQLEVGINVPIERVVSARIHLSQPESGLDFSADVDLQSEDNVRRIGDEAAVLYYAWQIDPLVAPPLFSTVQFDWSLRLVENVSAQAYNSFQFADTRRYIGTEPIDGWRSVGATADPLQLIGHNPALPLDLVRTRSQRVLDKVRATIGMTPQFHFVIYDPGISFCGKFVADDGRLYIQSGSNLVFYPCNPQDALTIYQRQGYRVLERATLNVDQLVEQINDEIMRESFAAYWRVDQPPGWFREGLFQLLRPTTNVRALQIARTAERASDLLPLEALLTEPSDLTAAELWRAQAYLMTLYLADRFGADAPFRLAVALRDVYTFDAALQALFGVTPDVFYLEWSRWLLTEAADRASRWTPYLETTPTPTETLRPFPSRTPTSSIPTETPTPRPTLTAPPFDTFTPVPPTATNTPRPPGSLRSPTPVPTPVPEGSLTTIAQSPLAIVGIVIAVVLLVIVVITVAGRGRGQR